MEVIDLTILGNYRPFTDKGSFPSSSTSAPSVLPTKQKGPKPFHFGPPKVKDTKVENALGSVMIPHYELFPPTIDDIVMDETILHNNSPRRSPALSEGYDVELTIEDSKVTWSQSHVLRKVFSMEAENETVRQVLFAWFLVSNTRQASRRMESTVDRTGGNMKAYYGNDNNNGALPRKKKMSRKQFANEGKMQALVIVLERIIKIYYPNGEDNIVNIPFAVEKVWAMELGILIEAKSPSKNSIESMIPTTMETNNRVAFHMLIDPYEMPESVLVLRFLEQGASLSGKIGLQERLDVDNDNTCVFVSQLHEDDQTLVTFDMKTRRHRFWSYRSKRSPAKSIDPDPMAMDVDDMTAHGSSISEIFCDVHPAW
jgi:hypothetical protein